MSVPLCPYPVWVLFLKLKLKLRVAQPTSWGPTEPTRYRSLAEGLCCRELAEAAPGEPTRGNRHISMIHVRDPRYSQAGEGARPTYERNEGPIRAPCLPDIDIDRGICCARTSPSDCLSGEGPGYHTLPPAMAGPGLLAPLVPKSS